MTTGRDARASLPSSPKRYIAERGLYQIIPKRSVAWANSQQQH